MRVLPIAFLAALLASCGGGGTPVTPPPPPAPPPPPLPAAVASVAVTPTTATVTVAGTQALTVTVRDAAGAALSGRAVTWTSGAASVATVSAGGVVTGVSAGGPVTITATSEGKSGTAQLTVTGPAVALTTDTFGAESYHTCQLIQGTGTIVFCSGEGQFGQLGRSSVVATQLIPLQLVGSYA